MATAAAMASNTRLDSMARNLFLDSAVSCFPRVTSFFESRDPVAPPYSICYPVYSGYPFLFLAAYDCESDASMLSMSQRPGEAHWCDE